MEGLVAVCGACFVPGGTAGRLRVSKDVQSFERLLVVRCLAIVSLAGRWSVCRFLRRVAPRCDGGSWGSWMGRGNKEAPASA